jgi:hypothetical protein
MWLWCNFVSRSFEPLSMTKNLCRFLAIKSVRNPIGGVFSHKDNSSFWSRPEVLNPRSAEMEDII